jgi:hypothetical protein
LYLSKDPQRAAEGIALMKSAAEHGYLDAINNLGKAYFEGNGVAVDYEKARYYFKQAADKGNETAKNNLSIVEEVIARGNKRAINIHDKSFGFSEKMKNLDPIQSIKCADGSGLSYDSVAKALSSKYDEYELSYNMVMGSLSNGLLGGSKDALFVFHPDHINDYFKIVLTITRTGRTATVDLYSSGKSKQFNKESLANTRVFDGSGAKGASVGLLRGGSVGVGYAIGSATASIAKAGFKAIKKGFNKLTMDSNALEEEKNWYGAVLSLIYELFQVQ